MGELVSVTISKDSVVERFHLSCVDKAVGMIYSSGGEGWLTISFLAGCGHTELHFLSLYCQPSKKVQNIALQSIRYSSNHAKTKI